MGNMETKVLSAVGIYRGVSNPSMSYWQVVGEDETGKQYVMTFGSKSCYKETMEKYFAKMTVIPAPKEEKPITDTIIVKKESTEDGINRD